MDCDLVGVWQNRNDAREYWTVRADGTFTLALPGRSASRDSRLHRRVHLSSRSGKVPRPPGPDPPGGHGNLFFHLRVDAGRVAHRHNPGQLRGRHSRQGLWPQGQVLQARACGAGMSRISAWFGSTGNFLLKNRRMVAWVLLISVSNGALKSGKSQWHECFWALPVRRLRPSPDCRREPRSWLIFEAQKFEMRYLFA